MYFHISRNNYYVRHGVMKTIGIVTVGRSDYGIYVPVLKAVQAHPNLRLHLIAAGMHLSPEFGSTALMIEEDGFEIGDKVEMLLSSETPEGIAKSIGLGTIGFAQSFGRFKPDILVVLGDRFEMYAAALAALPFKIPVAHIHGGELTMGAIDDALRHSITKLSHLHFVAMEEYARRVMQLGEEPWRVVVSGAPSLDNVHSVDLLSKEEMEANHNINLSRPPLLVTFHPVTLEYEQTERQVSELLAALDASGLPVIFTMPNADTYSRVIQSMISDYAGTHSGSYVIDNLGIQNYFSLMSFATAMVGNSSSGIIEAATFGLPVVNIGTRQDGRIRSGNVVDVGYTSDDILDGIRTVSQSGFRNSLRNMLNVYGTGHASKKIVDRLHSIVLDTALVRKRFHDVHTNSGSSSDGIRTTIV